MAKTAKKRGGVSTFIKITIIVLMIVLVILVGYFIFKNPFKNNQQGTGIVLVNPIASIVYANTKNNIVNQSAVVQEGIMRFNEDYIIYLLAALGASDLHKSSISYGNPKIEMILDNEVWNSELGDVFITKRGNSDNPDIRIRMTKEVAVIALMNNDIKKYMKDSVQDGKIQIEMIAGKVELFSKGYLDMYKALAGKEADI